MQRVSLFLLCGVLAALLASSAGAIVGGDLVDESKPWSVKVTTPDGMCSGSLVAQQWVMTAAHCVLDLRGITPRQALSHTPLTLKKIPPTEFTLFVGGSGKRHAYSVDRTEAAAFRAGPPRRFLDDIGLLHLTQPVPGNTAPLPLAPSRASVPGGAHLTFWGYGVSKAPPWLALRITKPGDWALDTTCQGVGNACYVHPKGPSFPTAGDSGAPVATYVRGSWVQRGIFTGPGPRFDGTASTQYGADVVAHLAWIRRVTGLPTIVPNTLLHDPITGAAWLVGDDRFRHAIRTPAVYSCLLAAGAQVREMPSFAARSVPEDHTAAATCG